MASLDVARLDIAGAKSAEGLERRSVQGLTPAMVSSTHSPPPSKSGYEVLRDQNVAKMKQALAPVLAAKKNL